MATRTGSAAEFILALLELQPERTWRISELHAECAGKWKADNFHETLKRLLAAGRVRKRVGEAGSAWWSSASGLSVAPVPSSPHVPSVPPVAEAPSGTASQFILDLLGKQPDLEWRVAEIVQAGDNRWTEPNVRKSLTGLFKAGKLKKNVNGGVWWSAASARPTTAPSAKAASTAAKPAMSPAPVSLPEEPVTAAEQSAGNAAAFILDLLTNHPDYEMQVRDILEECERKWAEQTISDAVEKLVKQGRVVRVKDGRHVWYSIAGS